jgi:phosphohistidine phosphatase SixA
MNLTKININQATDNELKAMAFSLIENAKNRFQLLQYIEAVNGVYETYEQTEYNLTPEQEAQLIKDIEETYDDENLISHEAATEELKRWLPK